MLVRLFESRSEKISSLCFLWESRLALKSPKMMICQFFFLASVVQSDICFCVLVSSSLLLEGRYNEMIRVLWPGKKKSIYMAVPGRVLISCMYG